MHLKYLFTFAITSRGTYNVVRCMGFGVQQARVPVLASLLPSCMTLSKFLNQFEPQFPHLNNWNNTTWLGRLEEAVRSCQHQGSCGYFRNSSMMVLYLWLTVVCFQMESSTSAVIIVSVSLGLHRIFIFVCGIIVGIVVKDGTLYFVPFWILLPGH